MLLFPGKPVFSKAEGDKKGHYEISKNSNYGLLNVNYSRELQEQF